MTAPLIDGSIEEGSVWVRTRAMRARFNEAGGTVYPVFGASSPRDGVLNTDTISVTADALFSYPTVSSLSDADVPSTNDRAAVVAFERAYADITSPTGFQTDISRQSEVGIAALRFRGSEVIWRCRTSLPHRA